MQGGSVGALLLSNGGAGGLAGAHARAGVWTDEKCVLDGVVVRGGGGGSSAVDGWCMSESGSQLVRLLSHNICGRDMSISRRRLVVR